LISEVTEMLRVVAWREVVDGSLEGGAGSQSEQVEVRKIMEKECKGGCAEG